jgi:hypothetical protein
MTWILSGPNAFWNTWLWTVGTRLANATQRDWLSCRKISADSWSLILSSLPLYTLILSTFRIPLWISGTHSDNNRQHRCKILQPKLPIPDALSPQDAPPILRLGSLSSLLIPRHQPFIIAFRTTWPSYWRSGKKFQQPAKLTSKQNLSLFFMFFASSPFYLSSRPFCPSTTFVTSLPPVYPPLRPPSFLPLSPLQCNSLPCHSSRRLTPALHNTQTKRKASPCIVCSSNGEIPAAKMTANKTKIKPQKHVVFTPVRWPTVWSHIDQCCVCKWFGT